MRILLLLILLTSCGMPVQDQGKQYEKLSDSELYDVRSEFYELADKYKVQAKQDVDVVFGDVYRSACLKVNGEDTVVVNKEKWESIDNALNDPDREDSYPIFRQAKRNLIFGSLGACSIQSFNRTVDTRLVQGLKHLVPVAYSLTRPKGIVSSWMIQYCYEDDSKFGIYASEEDCPEGLSYGINLKDAYYHELFTGDPSFVIEISTQYDEEIEFNVKLNYCKRYFPREYAENCPYHEEVKDHL